MRFPVNLCARPDPFRESDELGGHYSRAKESQTMEEFEAMRDAAMRRDGWP